MTKTLLKKKRSNLEIKEPITALIENPALTDLDRKAPIPISPDDIRGNKSINQAASSIL